jgi:hypothetical protein
VSLTIIFQVCAPDSDAEACRGNERGLGSAVVFIQVEGGLSVEEVH